MLVYRVCSQEEITMILEEKSFENVGKSGKDLIAVQQQKNVNNHEYHFQKNYLHFYKDKMSMFYMKTENTYLCTYNIPDDILAPREKEGYYLDFVNYRRIVRVPEYALETSLLNFDYLDKVEYINEYIDIDDYITNKNLTDSVNVIYLKDKGMVKERRIF